MGKKRKSGSNNNSNQNTPRPLKILRKNLDVGSFLVRIECTDGKVIDNVVRNLTDLEYAKRNVDYYSSPFTQSKLGIGRKSVQVVSWDGRFIKFRELKDEIRDINHKISEEYILKSLGFDKRFDDIEIVDGGREIILKQPRNLKHFEKAWEEILEKGNPDTLQVLYHGTLASNISTIFNNHFRLPRFCHQAFGRGVYLGKPPKARNYAYANWNCKYKVRYMIEAEVLLGKVYKAPKVLYKQAKKDMEAAGCDSVYYNGFRQEEWIVYNPHQILIKKAVRIDQTLV